MSISFHPIPKSKSFSFWETLATRPNFFLGGSLFCMKWLIADLTPDDSPTAIEGEASDDLMQNLKEINPVARSVRNFS